MFMSDVSIIVRKMRTMAERNQSFLGIGFPEQLVLMHLKAYGSCNQESIASSLDIDKGAIAKTIAKLEVKGLVTREINPKNKREKLNTLTPQAEKILVKMSDSYGEFERALFAGLSKSEQASLEKSIAAVARNVSEL